MQISSSARPRSVQGCGNVSMPWCLNKMLTAIFFQSRIKLYDTIMVIYAQIHAFLIHCHLHFTIELSQVQPLSKLHEPLRVNSPKTFKLHYSLSHKPTLPKIHRLCIIVSLASGIIRIWSWFLITLIKWSPPKTLLVNQSRSHQEAHNCPWLRIRSRVDNAYTARSKIAHLVKVYLVVCSRLYDACWNPRVRPSCGISDAVGDHWQLRADDLWLEECRRHRTWSVVARHPYNDWHGARSGTEEPRYDTRTWRCGLSWCNAGCEIRGVYKCLWYGPKGNAGPSSARVLLPTRLRVQQHHNRRLYRAITGLAASHYRNYSALDEHMAPLDCVQVLRTWIVSQLGVTVWARWIIRCWLGGISRETQWDIDNDELQTVWVLNEGVFR